MSDVTKFNVEGTVINCKDSTARSDIATKAPKSEAIKNITRSGTTFTATRCDDTTFTFTQQDNNTTTGTTYKAGSVPANTTFGTNGSIKNSYDSLNTNKAAKSEAIKSITRSGTTFTATRCDNTTFTFTQQDNNTTTGTTYTAGNVPANTTFGTNGSIKNAYDNLKFYNTCPEYSSQVVDSGDKTPTSNAPYTHKCGYEAEIIYISCWKATAGNTLFVYVNNVLVYLIPAYSSGFSGIQITLLSYQTLKITTDTTGTGWTINVRGFKHVLL